MFSVPAIAPSIRGWMDRSQMPVRLDGASTSGGGSVALVEVVGGGEPCGGLGRAGGVPVVATGRAMKAAIGLMAQACAVE